MKFMRRKPRKLIKNEYTEKVKESMKTFYDSLSEKDRRRYAAIEVLKFGYGGKKYICKILGCDIETINRGLEELLNGFSTPEDRERLLGGGRKRIMDTIENIDEIFFEIIKDNTAGNPMDAELQWTNLTIKEISEAFIEKGYSVQEHTVKQLLEKHNFVKRKMQKTKTIKDTQDRNEQFEKINELKQEYENAGNPIISIDVKKKEQIGNFYRDGKSYCIESQKVNDHDFTSESSGVIIPHGIYDLKRNEAYITLGTSKDTGEFCCDCLNSWWNEHGKIHYANATSILILADGGGSNSSRHYIFKEDIQKLANDIGIEIKIAHYPPYTSKYNPIEHRVFCHVTRACSGVVFTSVEVVNELVKKTKTKTGLKVFSKINKKLYQTARKISDGFKEQMTIVFDSFLGKWNYRAVPQS